LDPFFEYNKFLHLDYTNILTIDRVTEVQPDQDFYLNDVNDNDREDLVPMKTTNSCENEIDDKYFPGQTSTVVNDGMRRNTAIYGGKYGRK
jgi:hypothetical protein